MHRRRRRKARQCGRRREEKTALRLCKGCSIAGRPSPRSRSAENLPARGMVPSISRGRSPRAGTMGRQSMSVELKSALFDEPAAADAETAPKKFKFAATFVIDLAISLVFIAAVVPVWASEMDRGLVLAPTFAHRRADSALLRRQGSRHRPSRPGRRRRAHLCEIVRAGHRRSLRLFAQSDLSAGDDPVPAVVGPGALSASLRRLAPVDARGGGSDFPPLSSSSTIGSSCRPRKRC